MQTRQISQIATHAPALGLLAHHTCPKVRVVSSFDIHDGAMWHRCPREINSYIDTSHIARNQAM